MKVKVLRTRVVFKIRLKVMHQNTDEHIIYLFVFVHMRMYIHKSLNYHEQFKM